MHGMAKASELARARKRFHADGAERQFGHLSFVMNYKPRTEHYCRLCCIKRHSFQNPTLAQQSCASCRARFFLDMDFLSKEICFCNRAS